jgi:hypothetical protein
MRYTEPDAIVLGTAPAQIKAKDLTRVVMTLQNQDPAAIIYRRFGGDGTPRSYLQMVPGATEVKDQHCPQEELWAYSNVAGTILTIETITDNGQTP